MLALAGDKEAGRRLTAGEHDFSTVEHPEQQTEPAFLQAAAQPVQHTGFTEDDGLTQGIAANPGGEHDFPEKRQRIALVGGVLQRKRTRHQCRIAQARIDGIDPTTPVVVGAGRPFAGFADAEFTCQFELFRAALRQQGEWVEPADAFRENLLADAGLGLAALEGGFKGLLPGFPLSISNQRRRPQSVAAAAFDAVQGLLQQNRVTALQGDIGQGQTQTRR